LSSLTFVEKRQLEDFLDMGGGYVLDFSNRTFQEFVFDAVKIDIYAGKYDDKGGSKANHLRCFWEKEGDPLVGRLLKAMVEYGLDVAESRAEYTGDKSEPRKSVAYRKSWHAVQRLLGNPSPTTDQEVTEEDFLRQKFSTIPFDRLPIEGSILPLIQERFRETEKCFNAGANLSAVILSGSILEAVLLGLGQANPKQFNTAKAAPKDEAGRIKQFNGWKLAEFISVAHEIGALKQDVRKFSDHLRGFRNYIHPYEQLATGFNPDKHTAEICLTVLKAAICQITEWGGKS